MTRLFTFGCSFTQYTWPMWSDIFGLEFDHFENWGISGVGNVAIANRIVECHVKNNFTPEDIIVVQWSSHIRNDYHLFRRPPVGRDSVINWKTKGSMFNYLNKDLYDKKWMINFFDERSYIMLSLNAIHSSQLFLESTGCQWAMTTIGDFNKLGSDYNINPVGYGENRSDKSIDLWTEFPTFLPYKDKIWNDKFNWVEPIGKYCWQQEEELYSWQDPSDPKPWVDPHPSVNLNIDWLYNKLKPALGLDNSTLNAQQKEWVAKCAELKSQINRLDEFGEVASRTLNNYDISYRGY